jgi:protein-S-isoprenylcysteine O-methyltransferase Ste14
MARKPQDAWRRDVAVWGGLAVGTVALAHLMRWAGVSDLTAQLPFVPPQALAALGLLAMAAGALVLVAMLPAKSRRQPFGHATWLRKEGIFLYVRYPLHSGLGFGLVGAGLGGNETGVFLAGLAWFAVADGLTRHEDREFDERFGEDFRQYKRETARLYPRLDRVIVDLLTGRFG